MKFHGYRTAYEVIRTSHPKLRFTNWSTYYQWAMSALRQGADANNRCPHLKGPGYGLLRNESVQAQLENNWYIDSRPYYKVWPTISAALEKIRLDISIADAKLTERVVAIRFAEKYEPKAGSLPITGILTAIVKDAQHGQVMMFASQYVGDDGEQHETDIMGIAKSHGTIEDRLNSIVFGDFGLDSPGALLRKSATFAFAVHLLADDATIIEPEVLAGDRLKYAKTKDPKYIDKAKRRGVVGWRIGEAYEIMPHYRRPHFGIRHTGKGGKIPRIVAIKGAVVHRKKLTDVPTGYLTPEGKEIEPQCA